MIARAAPPRSPLPRTARAALALLSLGVLAALLLPLLACVAVAGGEPAGPTSPYMAEQSVAALGGVSRLLHGDGCVRVEPLVPVSVDAARPVAVGAASACAPTARRTPLPARTSMLCAEPARLL